MKKANSKLVLQRETVRTLKDADLSRVVGGDAHSEAPGGCVSGQAAGAPVKVQTTP